MSAADRALDDELLDETAAAVELSAAARRHSELLHRAELAGVL
jgi:hypothetical protein